MFAINESWFMYINIAILIMTIVFVFLGYKKGFVRSIVSLFTSLIAMYVAWLFSGILAEHLPIWPVNIHALNGTALAEAARRYINEIFWFVVLVILVRILLTFVNYLLKSLKDIPLIGKFDSLLGGVFGVVESCIWIFILSIILALPVFKNGMDVKNNTVIGPVSSISSAIFSHVSNEFKNSEAIDSLLDGKSQI
ncbi:MAG: CvpA family protein [Solobacterium sp.]|nr:CvpA family protein [Solobacterium sp.]